jgi:hypothetical protein
VVNRKQKAGDAMQTKLNSNIVDGLMPAEKIARIQDVDGKIEEVTVSTNNLSDNKFLMASEIGRNAGNVLVELPRESASGRWRMWVKESSIGG